MSQPPSHHLPSLFSQVCNCNKYLKVPKERMRQLVEGSKHSAGDSGTSTSAGSRGWVGWSETRVLQPTQGCAHPRGLGPSDREWGPWHQAVAGSRCGPAELSQAPPWPRSCTSEHRHCPQQPLQNSCIAQQEHGWVLHGKVWGG